MSAGPLRARYGPISSGGLATRPVQGRDLSPLFAGSRVEPAPALLDMRRGGRRIEGLRDGRKKLLRWKGPRLAWFDLEADPGERAPLPGDAPGYAEALAALDAVRAESLAIAGERAVGAPGAKTQEDLRRRLEALGYIDDPADAPQD